MDSRAHIFTSDTRIGEADGCTLSSSNRPTAVVEVTDPNQEGDVFPIHIWHDYKAEVLSKQEYSFFVLSVRLSVSSRLWENIRTFWLIFPG